VDGFAISQMPTALTADRALMSQHGNRKKKVDCQATGQNMTLLLAHSLTFAPIKMWGKKLDTKWHFLIKLSPHVTNFVIFLLFYH